MDYLPRAVVTDDIAALISNLVELDGAAAHPHMALAVAGDRHSFVRDLIDFADFVHLICLLHGQLPGLIDHAASHTTENAAREWLIAMTDGFSVERTYLGRLAVLVGPLPSTAGHHETTSVIAQQRHAIEMLAQSDRRGCALGSAVTLALEWESIRAILDAGAIRLGIEPPPCAVPHRLDTLTVLSALPEPARLMRAIQFGATQLLGQHRGLWDLLQARAAVRRETIL